MVRERPGHIYSHGRPKFLEREVDHEEDERGRLRRKLAIEGERLAKRSAAIEKLVSGFQEKDLLNLRFIIQYENNPLLFKVIKMVMVLFQVESVADLIREMTLERIKGLSLDDLDRGRADQLSKLVVSDRRLNFDMLMTQSHILAVIFEITNLMATAYKSRDSIQELKARINPPRRA